MNAPLSEAVATADQTSKDEQDFKNVKQTKKFAK